MRGRRYALAAGVLVLLAALAVATPVSAVKKIGLSSGSFEFNVAPGQSGKGEVVAIDDGDEPIKVFVYTADQKVDEKGGITFVVPNRDDPQFLNAPSSWVRVRMPETSKAIGNTPYIEMKPTERTPVKFDFTVPPGAVPGDYNVLVFFEMFDVSKATGAQASVAGRLGSRLKIRVKGEFIEDMEVRPFSVPRFVIGREVSYVFLVRNQGNLDKSVSAVVELQDTDGETIASSTPMTETAVYAGSNNEASGKVVSDKLLFGRYTVRLTATYPKESKTPGKPVPTKIVEERQTWVFPLWFVVLVGALLLGVLLWIAWRLAVRSAAKRARKERVARREAARARIAERKADAAVEVDLEPSSAEAGDEPGDDEPRGVAGAQTSDPGRTSRQGGSEDWADEVEF